MKINKQEKKISIIALLTVLITVLIIIYSEESFQAALEGLKVWWEIVFPSLLPFFIIAEVLMGLGVVHFLGALLEPLMRPLFKVPGVGAFAMAMGLASGYPIGAKITANLRQKNLCTKTEGERLLSFTNTADPLFMIGAVAVGMFHRADIAIIIAGAHYISSILIGFVMRFHRGNEKEIEHKNERYNNIFVNAFYQLITARKNDGRKLGELLGDSVRESINTLLLVGGFIILFSVITKIVIVAGFLHYLIYIIGYIFKPFGLSNNLVLPLISGFFEITNGANIASQSSATLLEQLIIVNAIIAWSGLSVHAQVATMINGTDIKLKPYIYARILQSIFAGFITIILYKLLSNKTLAVFTTVLKEENFPYLNIINLFKISISILLLMIILSTIIFIIKK